jgi:SAM-dependent methyltransferase
MPRGALRDIDLREIGFDAPGRVRDHIPSPLGVLRRILRPDEVRSEDVFIDIGCGMGPVLVEAAARYDFRRVIGIDIVPQFTDVARETIARGRDRLRCQDVEVLTGDVTEYEPPDDVTVVYMADPFRTHTFDAVIAKLVASVDRSPRRLRLIYHNPVEAGRLERTGRAHLARYGRRRNRPWTTAPDLAMYVIEPSGDGVGPDGRYSPALPRALRRRPLSHRSFEGRTSNAGGGGRAAREATIRIVSSDSSGSMVVSEPAQGLDSLRAAFERDHCVRLPGFLSSPLLERLQGYVDEGEFSVREYEGIRTEPCMEHGKAAQLLMLLVNDPHLFNLVRVITDSRRIGRFEGTIYRVMPGVEHEDPWHGEIFGHAMVAMGIDLSTRPYAGGVLEVRDRDSHVVLHGVDTEPGDAVLLRFAPFLQHRVTAVKGDSARTVYAGKFWRSKSGEDSKLARPGSFA